MHPDEEGLIQQLATKMEQDQPVEKDADAAALINQTVATQPDAVYILTQATLVQEQALHAAQQQIASLQAQLAQAQNTQAAPPVPTSGGGFLSHLFGQPSGSSQNVATASPGGAVSGGGGNSFLRGAATTAVGVVAGETIFSGLGDLFN
jgi:hypothetical protein